MPLSLLLKFGPYAAIALLFWLWLNARDDVASALEACNTRTAAAIAEAEKVTRETEREAAERQILELRALIESAENAREIAIQAAREAESRPVRVQEVVRRVADENLCIDLPLPAAVLDSLRQ